MWGSLVDWPVSLEGEFQAFREVGRLDSHGTFFTRPGGKRVPKENALEWKMMGNAAE